MKCPNCRYVSFEHLSRCKKCGHDLAPIKEEARIDFPQSMRLGLLSRSEAEGGEKNVDLLFNHGEDGDDTDVSSKEGSGFNGVASVELGTDGLGSVEKNIAGEILLGDGVEENEVDVIGLELEEPGEEDSGPDESLPSEIQEEGSEQEGIAFDSTVLEDVEKTADSGNRVGEMADDDLKNISLEVEDLDDTLDEEIDIVMSTPHTEISHPQVDDDDADKLPDFGDDTDNGDLLEDETLTDHVISAEKLVDTDTMALETANEISDLPTDKPAEDRPKGAPKDAGVIELNIDDDELEIVSEGKKAGEKPFGIDLEDLDLTLSADESGEDDDDLDEMDIDLDDDIQNMDKEG